MPCLLPSPSQVIFRHLFEYKYSSMELAAAWQGLGRALLQQQRAAAREQRPDKEQLKRQHAEQVFLRSVGHKLLHLVQEYVRYMCQDVVEPRWQAMEVAMGKAANLDVVRGGGAGAQLPVPVMTVLADHCGPAVAALCSNCRCALTIIPCTWVGPRWHAVLQPCVKHRASLVLR